MLIRRYRYFSPQDYCKMQKKTKIYLNTLSPISLVSPRYFESMASRAMVLCQESDVYERIFPDSCYVTFKTDLSDFNDKLNYYSSHEDERNKIVNRAYYEAMEKHTWEKRVEFILRRISPHS